MPKIFNYIDIKFALEILENMLSYLLQWKYLCFILVCESTQNFTAKLLI